MRRMGKTVLAGVLAAILVLQMPGERYVAAAESANGNTDAVSIDTEFETTEAEQKESETAETEITETEVTETEITETEVTETEVTETEITETEITETEEAETEVTETEVTETEVTETELTEAEVIETETETMPEREEEESALSPFSGLESVTLSSTQLAEKERLKSRILEIQDLKEGKDYTEGELVFSANTPKEAEDIAKAYGGGLKEFEEGIGVLILPEETEVMEALKAAAADSEGTVLPPVWPNYIYTACGQEDTFLNPAGTQYQWQHTMTGSSYAWNQGYTGKGIKIAVLDTGINNHKDLEIDTIAYNYSTDGDGADYSGHGTHTAGLIGAKRNNGEGGAGIAPEASIVNIKVLNDRNKGDSAGVARGIKKAAETEVGADIISISFASGAYDEMCAREVKAAYEKGIAVFAAAGNDGSKTKCYPACYEGAYAIGAVQQDKGKSYESNYGAWVKYSAPGSGLWSNAKNGTEYAAGSGTSQATAIVSGTAAVILAADETIGTKSGKEKVNALIKKMDSAKIAGTKGAAGIVYLPKALGITVSAAAPGAPAFTVKGGTFKSETLLVGITAKSVADTIYYSTDGKNPTYKNGILSANAKEYTGEFEIGQRAKVTVKAIAVSADGKVSKTATAVYNFKPPVTAIKVSGISNLLVGGSTTLKAVVTPDYAANKGITWSSSNQTAIKVNQNGKVTATKKAEAGKSYTITATAKDGSGTKKTFAVTVKEKGTVDKIEFISKKETVTRRGADLSYNISDNLKIEKSNLTTGSVYDADFSSSNPKVASVDNSGQESRGLVTVKGPGKTVITATANDGSKKKASFELTVLQEATDIAITGFSQVGNGKSIQMKAVLMPENVTVKGVTWDIFPKDKGVTIDKNGKVKAEKEAEKGKYTVTATAKDTSMQFAEKTITVSNNAISQIQLSSNKEKIFRVEGNYKSAASVKITASITAKSTTGNMAVSNAVAFTSSNPGVAKVEQEGNTATITATGKAAGTVKITCKAVDGSGKSASCTVTVVNPPSGIAVVPPGGTNGFIGVGKNVKLSAVLEEGFGKLASKAVVWETSDETAVTVNGKGMVKGKKAGGFATITARYQDSGVIAASYIVAVREPVKKLEIDLCKESGKVTALRSGETKSAQMLYNGKSYDAAENPVYPVVAFEIGNPDILSVEYEKGVSLKLRGKKAGSTTITVKALDGSNVKKSYKIKVN